MFQLNHNYLTRSSSSYINAIVLSCKVEELWIDDNETVGGNEKLYTHPSFMLTKFYMNNTSLSSTTARALFTALKDTNKLKIHFIIKISVEDAALAINQLLEKLQWMSGNPISGEAIIAIIEVLQGNSTLQELNICSQLPSNN